jgi:hypothetical protein
VPIIASAPADSVSEALPAASAKVEPEPTQAAEPTQAVQPTQEVQPTPNVSHPI